MNVINGTPGDDFLFGTTGPDIFQGFGGRRDRVFPFGGEDVVVFGTGTSDGHVTRTSIYGFQTDDDAIRLVDGARIDRVVERWYGLVIEFEGDGDVAYLYGFRLDADDLRILADDPLLTFYRDADGDGFGRDDDTVYPGAPEINDGKDNDQDGEIDEDNRPPVAGPDMLAVSESATGAIDVLANDTDDDGDLLAVASADVPLGVATTVTSAGGREARVVLASDGSLSFDPLGNFEDLPALGEDTVTLGYTVTDGLADAAGTITVRIQGENDPPTVSGPVDGGATDENAEPVVLDLLENASDVDAGDDLDIAGVSVASDNAARAVVFAVDAEAGTITIDPDQFDDLDDTQSELLTISFDVVDAAGAATPSSATLRVEGVTDGPLPPAAPTLALAASDTTGTGTTTAASATFTGTTSPNVTVALLDESDAVLATALANNTGKFRLPGIGLDLGENGLKVRATDEETGLSTDGAEISVIREEPPGGAANAALYWNAVALDVIVASSSDPAFASRALAMESIAVFNVLAAVDGSGGFGFDTELPSGAVASAAVAYAAHAVLGYLFPGQSALLEQALTDALAGEAGDLAPSETLGRAVADTVIALRDGDGWDEITSDAGSTAPGFWRPTAPNFLEGATPHWADLEPFLLVDGEQFRPGPPPSPLTDTITDDVYPSDLARVAALGRGTSAERTADETETARFWAGGTGTPTPPGHWNRIAANASAAEGVGLSQSAELLLKLNLALADAAIAAWDTKYAYDFWRPITILTRGAEIGGTPVAADPSWSPLVVTPNHPEYVSGHSTFSGAAATVLTDFFGEGYAFEDTASSTSGDLTRSFASFRDAAEDAGESRIFGGIHFDFSNLTGLALGADVAEWVLSSFDPAGDLVAPRITLTVEDGFSTALAPVIAGLFTDNLSGAERLIAYLDGAPVGEVDFAIDGSFSLPLALAEDGSDEGLHDLTLIGQDAAGNIAEKSIGFTLATTGPVLLLDDESVSDTNAELVAGSRLAGSVGLGIGNDLAALRYSIDGGIERPIVFDEDLGFDVELAIGALAPGDYTIAVTAVDLAGNTTVEEIEATLAERPPFTIADLMPVEAEADVGVTFRPLIRFSRPVDAATLTDAAFFATDSSGAPIAAGIVPLNDGTGAWLFFEDPLPGGEAITLTVDGDTIRAADGALLDADGDGTPGGLLSRPFTTVSTTPVPGTVLTGLVLDPGDDLFPLTPDDYVASPNGAQDFANHTYLNPIAGAEVYIFGREDEKVLTDANGRFTLTNVPAGQIKVVVDGRTASNAPAGDFFPEMVLDVTARPGVVNTIMGGMGPDEAQIARVEDEAFYLPRIPLATLMPLSDTVPTVVSPVSVAGTNLTAEQASQITLTVQPGSLVDKDGNPVTNGQIGIAVVPGALVVDMLPEGMPTPPIFLTIQGTDGGVFTEEAILSLPNIFNLQPGEQTPQFSYDHTTGLLVLNGYSTVTEDGALLVSDPGSGILQPGWNGAPPQRFSVLELDPRVYCPPTTGPGHGPDVTVGDFVSATANVSAPLGVIARTGNAAGVPLGAPGLGNTLGAVNTASNVNRLYNDLRDIKRAVVDNEVPDGLGGEVDANLGLILGAKLVRDVGKTFIDGVATFFNATGVGASSPPGRVANGLSAAIAVSEASINYANDRSYLQPTLDLRDRLAEQQLRQFPPNKPPSPDPNNTATREANQQLQQALDEFENEAPTLVQLYEQFTDQATELRDFFDDFDENQPYGGKELSELVDIDPDTGEVVTDPDTGLPESELIRQIADFVETAQRINEIGDVIRNLQAIRDAIAAAEAAVSENFGEPLTSALSGGNELVETTGGLVYEYLYGPVFYGMLTNLETGEVERFTFNPAQGYRRVLDPETPYTVTIFDPVSGQTSTQTFTSVPPRPAPLTVSPLMGDDTGAVGPGGLTETAAMVVGADFGVADSLLPGSNITDRQALVSGLAGSPQLVNVSGVTGIAEVMGTAEALALDATTGNGAALQVLAATGDYGLALIDVSRPSLPTVLGQIDLAGFASDVDVSEDLDLAAVATGDEGIAVVDISNATAPALAYTLGDFTGTEVVVTGDRILAARDGRIFAIDLPTGTELGSVGLGIGPDLEVIALANDGTTLYVLDAVGQLSVMDASTDLPALVGQIDLSAELAFALGNGIEGNGIAVGNGVVWIGGGSEGSRGGLVTVDVSDPATPVLISGIDSLDSAGGAVSLNGGGFGLSTQVIQFDNGTPFPAFRNSLDVFDASDPSETGDVLSRFIFDGPLNDVSIGAGLGFVAAGAGGVQVVRYLGFDVQGQAPDIALTLLPEDVDGTADGLQLFQGQEARFDIRVSDDVNLQSVDLLVNGAPVLSRVTFPWDLAIQLPTIEENGGSDLVTVEIRATDTGGNATTLDPIEIRIVDDLTPFEIVSITPADGAEILPGARSIKVDFSKPVEVTSITPANFMLMRDAGGAVAPTGIQLREGGTQVQVTYAEAALGAGAYTLTLDAAAILDRGGSALGADPITVDFDVIQVDGQTWISPASGTWNDPLNWSTGRTPEPADDVLLPLASGVVALINEDVGAVASVSVSGEGVLRTTLGSPATTGLVTGALTNEGNVDVHFGRLENDGATVNSGTLGVSGRGNYVARGNIVNSGEIVVSVAAGMNENAVFTTNAPLIELTGGGILRLDDTDDDDDPRANVRGSDTVTEAGTPIAETFRNVDNTLTGKGGFGVGFIFENLPGGKVLAEDGDTFVVTSGQIVNTGLIEARTGGVISFDSDQFVDPGGLFIVRVPALVENTGGMISSAGGSVWFGDSTLRGGTLVSTVVDGVFGSITIDGGTLEGTVEPIAANAFITTFGRSFLQGSITNSFQLNAGNPGRFDEFGNFVVEASGIWSLSGDTVLDGGGLISLNRATGAEAADFDAVLTTEVADETYDEDTGDLLATEGYTLTLANQSIFGRGTIGLSYAEDLDDGFLGDPALYPRLQLEIAAPSRVDANNATDGMTIDRVDLVNEGEIRVSGGGSMDIVSSTLQQVNGRILVEDGTLTIRDPEVEFDPSDFRSSGAIDVLGAGFLSIEQSIENQGTITVFGEMEASEYIFGGSVGTIFPIGVVQLFAGTGNTIDFSSADGVLVLGDSSLFIGVMDFFEAGDQIHFTEFDPFSTAFTFVDNGPGVGTGTLTLDDGFGFTADIDFARPAGGFGPSPEDNFALAESDDYGGTLLTSTLEYF